MTETPDPKAALTITVRSATFHFDPPYATSFYEAMGRIVFLWGRFEQCIEHPISDDQYRRTIWQSRRNADFIRS
jgi:hypothetical protein